MSHELIHLFARTIRGIEWIAAAEIEKRCDATINDIRHREVRFQLNALDQRLLDVGSVDDLFLTCSVLEGLDRTRATLSLLASRSSTINFAQVIEPLGRLRRIPTQPCFDVIASLLGRRNYNRYEIEDTIADVIQRQTGWRYTPNRGDTPTPLDLSFRVHLSGTEAIIGVRLSRDPLHRRIYKIASRTGTLHPPLAFTMAMLSNLSEKQNVLDPFCGVGTIPIEALRVEPRICSSGVDIDHDSILKAVRNARAAKVHPEFLVADAGQIPFSNGVIDRVISNPPWGRTVGVQGKLVKGTLPFFEEIKRVSTPAARIVLISDSVAEHQDSIERNGLKLLLQTPVSLFGSWAEISLLADSSIHHEPLFDDASIFGPTLNKYWQQWPAVLKKTSTQS